MVTYLVDEGSHHPVPFPSFGIKNSVDTVVDQLELVLKADQVGNGFQHVDTESGERIVSRHIVPRYHHVWDLLQECTVPSTLLTVYDLCGNQVKKYVDPMYFRNK